MTSSALIPIPASDAIWLRDIPLSPQTEAEIRRSIDEGLAKSDGLRIWATDRGRREGYAPLAQAG